METQKGQGLLYDGASIMTVPSDAAIRRQLQSYRFGGPASAAIIICRAVELMEKQLSVCRCAIHEEVRFCKPVWQKLTWDYLEERATQQWALPSTLNLPVRLVAYRKEMAWDGSLELPFTLLQVLYLLMENHGEFAGPHLRLVFPNETLESGRRCLYLDVRQDVGRRKIAIDTCSTKFGRDGAHVLLAAPP